MMAYRAVVAVVDTPVLLRGPVGPLVPPSSLATGYQTGRRPGLKVLIRADTTGATHRISAIGTTGNPLPNSGAS
jgi:hypothetical protein